MGIMFTEAVELTVVHNAVSVGGVCLDGSPPAYQLDWGFGDGQLSWLVHLEGGSWCNNSVSCHFRVNNTKGLGSSTNMEVVPFSGILSNDSELNPNFYNWNRVYVRYCDGSSFTGNKTEPDPVYGLYYRGGVIFDAIVEDLLDLGMEDAKDALLSGCSAGGLAAILHCDRFRFQLPLTTNVKCLSDAGFFIHVADACGHNSFEKFYSEIVELHHSADYLPKPCTTQRNSSLCFFPQYVVPAVTTPLFLLNSGYDTWQIGNILAPEDYCDRNVSWSVCKYDIQKCSPDQSAKWEYFRTEFLKTVTDLGDDFSRGLFINSCHTHCQSQSQKKWLGDPNSTLDGMSISDALGEWFFDENRVQIIDFEHDYPQQCVLDPSEPYPCNGYKWGNGSYCSA